MGNIGKKYAKTLIITSDNPRTEDPDKIISDISSDLDESQYIKIPDRKMAIEKALEIGNANSVIAIAGKGHEKFQIIGSDKIPFSDHEVVRNHG